MKEKFLKILAPYQVSEDPKDLEHYGADWTKEFKANASFLVFPKTTEEVQKVILLANQENIKLVPSGGRTGYSGGATATNKEVILSLEKINHINEIDQTSNTITCGAGALTEKIMDKAEQANLFLPFDLASKGSSQIGGNLATNAGGSRVLKYGRIRKWVQGITAVTGKGEILDLNTPVVKDQTGYDLKQVIIGSEGTLAVITEACLKLIAKPKEINRLLLAHESIDACLEAFYAFRAQFSSLSAAEYFSNDCLEEVLKHKNLKSPFQSQHQEYLLLEFEENSQVLTEESSEILEKFLNSGTIQDAIVSQSKGQADQLLQYRELISETLGSHYSIHKNDISVPSKSIPEFLKKLNKLIDDEYSNYSPRIFGHLGDGNLHLNYIIPDVTKISDLKLLDKDVFSLIKDFNGSISAEHGIGLLKKDFLNYNNTPEEIELMKRIKRDFDPNCILNPGKIFDIMV